MRDDLRIAIGDVHQTLGEVVSDYLAKRELGRDNHRPALPAADVDERVVAQVAELLKGAADHTRLRAHVSKIASLCILTVNCFGRLNAARVCAKCLVDRMRPITAGIDDLQNWHMSREFSDAW